MAKFIDRTDEDGTVVKNKKYSRFLSGNIGNPNFSYR